MHSHHDWFDYFFGSLSKDENHPCILGLAKQSFKTICEIEGVVYFIDPKSPGSVGFLGGKERVTIPLTEEHYSLEAFKKHIVALAGLKNEVRV